MVEAHLAEGVGGLKTLCPLSTLSGCDSVLITCQDLLLGVKWLLLTWESWSKCYWMRS